MSKKPKNESQMREELESVVKGAKVQRIAEPRNKHCRLNRYYTFSTTLLMKEISGKRIPYNAVVNQCYYQEVMMSTVLVKEP
jgi:hypothetical protein